MFLLPVRSVGHTVHSGAIRLRKRRCTIFHGPVQFPQKAHPDTLDRSCVFTSGGICRLNTAFCCDQAMKMSMHHFSCSGGTSTDCTNSTLGHVTSNPCFSIRCDLTVFHAWVGAVWLKQIAHWDTLRRTCIF
jgi:hypothetical protein